MGLEGAVRLTKMVTSAWNPSRISQPRKSRWETQWESTGQLFHWTIWICLDRWNLKTTGLWRKHVSQSGPFGSLPGCMVVSKENSLIVALVGVPFFDLPG